MSMIGRQFLEAPRVEVHRIFAIKRCSPHGGMLAFGGEHWNRIPVASYVIPQVVRQVHLLEGLVLG